MFKMSELCRWCGLAGELRFSTKTGMNKHVCAAKAGTCGLNRAVFARDYARFAGAFGAGEKMFMQDVDYPGTVGNVELRN
ncbi:hypothetical protein [Corynebacterium pyruviciproducens]|uniref:Uncharacterized protein n=3 Tax=Corynebacterium pyruviciproducens TaxID=598660 RepID=A0AAF0YTM8_9CORY|nr:hypothetical protein [Corynebacterium pyruviciproducens]MDH4658335.1 hypothetical protein [Corynebacterium pyruviciproducens]MDK6565991.1 hypothetical protein [Corynebacterium pyruviciproducens]MDK7213600.1 hypothetical protein [Corynebacterium pyruviciproducens]WOT03250.1 hypothetical protein CYJ47_05705 [Corynebacterium pyruviciproducens]